VSIIISPLRVFYQIITLVTLFLSGQGCGYFRSLIRWLFINTCETEEFPLVKNTERKPHHKRGSKLEPYKDTIQEFINHGIFNCEVIYERIKEEGYTSGRTILRDYMKGNPDLQNRYPPHGCYETKPCQQAQVDWDEYTYIDEETGEIRKLTAREVAVRNGERGSTLA
jgi:hypothetical protein